MIFSDECTIQNSSANPNVWVWRYSYEAYDPKFVNLEDHGKPDIRIMVWAAIWDSGRTDLVIMTRDELAKKKGFTSNSYIKALEEGLLPNYDGTRHFQQDNASIHRSAATTEWLLNNAVSVIDWPPHSPDLNPIEHVWAMLKRRLYKMFPYLSNLHANKLDIAEFKECLQKAWQSLDQVKIRNLILSMPRRLAACVAAKGWYTRY